jgi:hypothetical protein
MPEELEHLFLLDIIGHEAADHPYFGSTSYYHIWEDEIARPLLIKAGYTILGPFYNLEDDAFGPLTRGCVASKDDKKYIIWYG